MAGSGVITATAATFAAEVEQSDLPVIVDFWAPWCGPCQQLTPILEQIAVEKEGEARVVKVNVDDHGDVAARFHVQGLPTLLFFVKGTVKGQMVGSQGKDAIIRKLEEATL
ncbi:MAG TPA: thioredoxin [Verrucomicrobiales bacterium]|nr:thioredoxin [Verrucomicrobiales bacterium]